MNIPKIVLDEILTLLKAKKVLKEEVIQNLWSDFGKIIRLHLESEKYPTAVLKFINPPKIFNHPCGWNTTTSHHRKLKSYTYEDNFYKFFSSICNKDNHSAVPKHLGTIKTESTSWLILEDLNRKGFNQTKQTIGLREAKFFINWLANFHAKFFNIKSNKLWKVGTYWHLETRKEEFKNIKNEKLKNIAVEINNKLNNSKYKTFVHGDAKLANFLFSDKLNSVAAVDFQYVGIGCGMKDLAYFTGGIFNEDQCRKYEDEILDYYFTILKKALNKKSHQINFPDLESEWRGLYPFAWADFYRFLLGWQPDHWKINKYGLDMIDIVASKIK